ncbi:MEKHLA domain-containing protein [Myxacorys almedinensis]|uniref:MEKHLA domain-containing protein n=1 Tax=Myxacorys almedinensis A TaxID=2690445 RepID=A0A8J7Z4W0_9CYAN|nr:MEKHLA domain-containing protein [Myxacorys almedinensis]NDJ19854.1 MEKHLA domain-containing protein [Myxacorys almedinensis A]
MHFSELTPEQHKFVIRHTQRLVNSFQHWTGRSLGAVPSELRSALIAPPDVSAKLLFQAPFVILSHGTEADPILNYGNHQALMLWEMDWVTFTQMPSRKTAEPIDRKARSRLLSEAKTKGYTENYQGIRISSTGKRFWIEDVLLWTVLDEKGATCGQAATFAHWNYLNVSSTNGR